MIDLTSVLAASRRSWSLSLTGFCTVPSARTRPLASSASFTMTPTLSFNATFLHGRWKICDSTSR
jgi:hypothetical protein